MQLSITSKTTQQLHFIICDKARIRNGNAVALLSCRYRTGYHAIRGLSQTFGAKDGNRTHDERFSPAITTRIALPIFVHQIVLDRIDASIWY